MKAEKLENGLIKIQKGEAINEAVNWLANHPLDAKTIFHSSIIYKDCIFFEITGMQESTKEELVDYINNLIWD